MNSPFTHLVANEVRRGAAIHGGLNNHDEAYSVLDEEVHEVREEVFRKHSTRDDAHLLEELVQVAAVAYTWLEATGIRLTLGADVPQCEELVLQFIRREEPPAASDHESLTRLRRLMARLWNHAVVHGPKLAACQHEVSLTLVTVMAVCRRWAEDRKLCPLTEPPERDPSGGRVTVVSSSPLADTDTREPASEPAREPQPEVTTSEPVHHATQDAPQEADERAV